MKIKTIMFIMLVTILVFLIYFTNKDNTIYYVNIDSTNKLYYNELLYSKLKKQNKLEKYVNNFSKEDYRTTDLIRDIKENKKVNNQTIQNALIKSDILTIYIGVNDINYKIVNTNKEELYKYTDQVLEDIEELLVLIRKYCKEKIYFIGFKNNIGISYNDYFEYTNKRLKLICDDNNIKFIDIDKKNQSINDIIINKVIKK